MGNPSHEEEPAVHCVVLLDRQRQGVEDRLIAPIEFSFLEDINLPAQSEYV